MHYLLLVSDLLNIYKQGRFITGLFIDRTAALIDELGETELNTAKLCLKEAHNSCRERS